MSKGQEIVFDEISLKGLWSFSYSAYYTYQHSNEQQTKDSISYNIIHSWIITRTPFKQNKNIDSLITASKETEPSGQRKVNRQLLRVYWGGISSPSKTAPIISADIVKSTDRVSTLRRKFDSWLYWRLEAKITDYETVSEKETMPAVRVEYNKKKAIW